MNTGFSLRLPSGGLLAGGALCVSLNAYAAGTVTYKANNTDNLNLTSSWEAGAVPSTTDIASWDSFVTAANSTLLGADLSWEGIWISNPAGPVSIGGTNTLSLGISGIDLSTATTNLSIATPLALTADQSWNMALGRGVSVSGPISGAFALTRLGAGQLTLNGSVSNSFGGTLTLSTLGGDATNTSTFFGKTGGAVAVPAGGTVQLGTVTTGAANLRMQQSNQFGSGVVMNFVNASGNWGRFDLQGTSQTLAGLNAGVLATQGGGVIQSRAFGDTASLHPLATLTLNGSGTYLYNGYIRDSDSAATAGTNQLRLIKEGSGTQTLAGNAISYTGGTVVNDGKLVLGAMVNAGTGTLRGAVTVNSPGTLDYAGDNSFGYSAGVNATSLTINGATVGGANFGNHFYQNFGLNMTGGSLLFGGTNNEFHNATITVNSSPNTATIARTTGNTTGLMRVRDGLPMTINVADGTQPVDLSISAPLVTVTAGSIVTKSGAGTLLLTGAQDNSSTILAATGGTTILDKSGATIRAAAGISNIATGATVRIAGTSGDQIYGAGTGNLSRVNMSGGTLDLAGLNEGWDRLEGTGTVTNSVAATTSIMTLGENNGSGVFAGSINNGAGAVKLVKTGTGVLGLAGSNNLSGAVEVNGGTLALSGTLSASATTVADAAGLAGEGSLASLTLGATTGSSLLADPATAGALTVTGALEVKGTTNVSLASGTYTAGVPFKVIGFGGKAGVWSNSNFTLVNTANYRGTPVFTENANDISLTLNGANLTWNNAAADLKWNTNTSANFNNGTGNDTFFWGDSVTFNDTPGANQAIIINGAQQPASMTVNSQYDYSFTSGTAGSLGGGMSLVKAGTGQLTLATTNTYLGTTTINGGTLLITADASLGAAPIAPLSGSLAINGGILRWNGNFNLNGNRGIALGAGGGTLNTVAAGNGNTINLSQAISGNGPLTLQANGDTSDTGGGVGGSTQLSNAGNSNTGNITITAGVVGINSNFGNASNTVLLNGGGLVDANLNINFARNLQIGALGGVYRSFGSVATGTLSGSISNAPGVPTTILRHTDGGTVSLTGDGSGFTGQYQNKRGNTRILSANWANTDFIEDTAGGWLEFRTGGASTVNSIASTRDVFVNSGSTLNVDSGVISMATNGHWWQTNLGAQGMLTSSSGTLTLTNGAASGTLGTLDHQMRLRLVDFNGSTPLTFVKNGVNQLPMNQANTYSGGTIVNAGRIHPDHLQALGTGPVTVNNGGQVMLSLAGTYTNNFTIQGPGQLEAAGTLGAIRFVNNTLAGSVTVAPAGSRITAHGGSGTHTGALLGSGNLEINSSASGNNGTINLNGNCAAYTGIATVSQGRLNLNAATFGGSVVSPDGTTLGGEPAVTGAVTLGSAAGSTLVIDAGTAGALTSGGAMTVNGTINVNAVGVLPAGAAAIKVVGFGSKAGIWNQNNFALTGTANYRPGTAFAETANAVELTIPTADLVWNNSVANSTWNTNLDANFQDSVPSNQTFFWGDRVSFGDLPGASQTITVSGTVQPGSITVDSQYDYIFNGGTIGGGSVLKRGTGMLVLNQANTFTSGLTVSQGVVRIGTLSGASTSVTVNDASTGAADTAFVASAALNGIATNVVVANQGSGNVTLGSLLGQAGLVVYNGTFQLGRAVTINGSSDRTTITGKISGNPGTIRIAGNAGNRTTISNATNDFTGDLVISTGVLYQNDNPTALPVTTSVTGEGTAQFRINAGGTHTINGLNGSGTTYIIAGGAATLSLGNSNGSGSYAGVISDSTAALSIAKNGSGVQEFTGTNTYTGSTTVNGGKLLANNTTGSGTGTGAVSVNATGTLGGTGAVAGAVTVNTGGTLAPGASIESLATGGLTLATGSTFAVEYNSSGVPTNDVVNVTGNVTLAGSLNLTDLAGAPAAITLGTKLTILTYIGTLSGNFAGLSEGGLVVSGPNTFKIRYADGGAVTLEATNEVADAFAAWASSKGLAGANALPDADPDNDGIANAIEFVLGGEPNPANPGSNSNALLPTITLDATYINFTYRRTDASAGYNPFVQYGINLAAWTQAQAGVSGVVINEINDFYGSGIDQVTVRIPQALAAPGSKLFARLKVTLP